ncbi:hypothetical protein TNCV_1598111 [Trichonephila clavipes]|nr:hypothetical protein TNCV_1598111 [Trichonephila clavipes]
MLPVLGKKAVLEWCMKEGLIGSSYVCPKCGKSVELRERTVLEFLSACSFQNVFSASVSKEIPIAYYGVKEYVFESSICITLAELIQRFYFTDETE